MVIHYNYYIFNIIYTLDFHIKIRKKMLKSVSKIMRFFYLDFIIFVFLLIPIFS